MDPVTLRSATISTFEELALLMASAADADVADSPLAGGVRVGFEGPLRGVLTVRVTADVLDAVAANMLGRAVPSGDPLCRDALGELANVLCGAVLPSLAGRRAEFLLSPPAWLGAAPVPPPAGGVLEDAVTLPLETGRAEVTLHLTGGVLPAGATTTAAHGQGPA